MSPVIATAQSGGGGPVALTIYNQDFAVARASVDLDLKAGNNDVTTTEVTSQLEPDSVVLRDPAGKAAFQIGEQNYDAGVIDQGSMLQKFEGKTIQFSNGRDPATGKQYTIEGRIIRAGAQPLIEVNGVMQFGLPGMPLFPASTDGLLLKPTLHWQIYSAAPEHLKAELAYITHGMSWQATYNVVAPEVKDVGTSDKVDLTGWVTIMNSTGTDFTQARVKLMAGDVAKLQQFRPRVAGIAGTGAMASFAAAPPEVTQQSFDDFHLYDLNRTVSLANGEIKQVQFTQATGVTMDRVYEYDGGAAQVINYYPGYHNDIPVFGLGSNTKVNVRAEIKNSAANHLGMPLPAGRIRLYRRDTAGQMEFVGEGTIPHTPAEETIKIPVGAAFDVTGARKQTDFHVDQRAHTIDESFSITLKNQKTTSVPVEIIEHMNRGQNWEITAKSSDFTKRDSSTAVFPVTVAAKGETTLTYTVHYSW